MLNVPSEKRLSEVPEFYSTEGTPMLEKKVHIHFFLGGSDWYVLEYDGKDSFFGYVILNNDIQMAEFGYFSFSELKSLNVGILEIDCELAKYWKPTMIKDIAQLKHLKAK